MFIDVERLEAGKFDNNLLQSIRQARHFLLVLTPNALDRCIGDVECKDWVHRVSLIRISILVVLLRAKDLEFVATQRIRTLS